MSTLRHGPPLAMNGYLDKEGRKFRARKTRYFRLKDSALFNHRRKDSLPTWGVSLIDSRVAVGHKSEVIVQLFDGKKLYLYPHSRSDCDRWVDLLQRASRRKIGNYYGVTGLVGMGSFAEVRVGYDKSTGQQVAIKVMKKNKRDSELMRSIDCEMNFISKNIDHENIVATYDVFDTRDNLFIVMEYMPGGMLYDILANEGYFTEKNAASVMKDLLYAVDCLHQHDIVHRDIKPENVLALHKTWPLKVKLADFGLADFVLENSFGEKSTCGMYGTPFFVAPEVIKAETYTPAVDIWSLGVLAYNMLSGQLPFDGNNIKEVLRRVRSGRYSFPDSEWADISTDAKQFISGLLEVDPKRRLTAQQALAHPWLTSANISERIITNDRSALGYEQRKLRMSSMAIDDVAGLLRLDDEDEATNANHHHTDHGIRALSRLFPGNHHSGSGGGNNTHAPKNSSKSGRSSGSNRSNRQTSQPKNAPASTTPRATTPTAAAVAAQQKQHQHPQPPPPQKQSNGIDFDDARFLHGQTDDVDEEHDDLLSPDTPHSANLPIPSSSSALSPSSPPSQSLSSAHSKAPAPNSAIALTPTQAQTQRKRPQRQRSHNQPTEAHTQSPTSDLQSKSNMPPNNKSVNNTLASTPNQSFDDEQAEQHALNGRSSRPLSPAHHHVFEDGSANDNDNSAAVSMAAPLRFSTSSNPSPSGDQTHNGSKHLSVDSANKVSVHEEDVTSLNAINDLPAGWSPSIHIGATNRTAASTTSDTTTTTTTTSPSKSNNTNNTSNSGDDRDRQRHKDRDEQFHGGGLEFNVVGNGDGFALPAILSVKDIMRRRHEAEQMQQDQNNQSEVDRQFVPSASQQLNFGSTTGPAPASGVAGAGGTGTGNTPSTVVTEASTQRRRRHVMQRSNNAGKAKGTRSAPGTRTGSNAGDEEHSSDSEAE